MPINREFVGRSFPPAEPYDVSRPKIAEFADAIGDPSPVYRDPRAAGCLGYSDVIAPPTFAILVTLGAAHRAVTDPELGVDWSRVVHASQDFSHRRPITAGDRLVGTATIEQIRSVGRNETITVRTDVHTTDGEPVCAGVTALLVRGPEEQAQ
ncbi:MAG: MaoC family dehydratase N-terminal domain-containing protein [Actinomycetota bacterium]|nr:MaoC family dehydratase N-terminal domain-containing protein [Actinomycetota bacterium]